MHNTGVTSVSFRALSPEEILQEMVGAGLKYIEWGSDIHAPYTDETRLDEIVKLMKKYDITCSSYGTYFRLGITPMEELPGYLKAAKKLGTNIARIWAGKARVEEQTPQWRQEMIKLGRQAAKIAEEEGVILCMECHPGTITEKKEYALEMIEGVNSPNFRTYWQQNPGLSDEENVAYIRMLKPYIEHIHVFYLPNEEKRSVGEGIDSWKTFMKEFSQEHTLLLEFMYDGRVESLPGEAKALHQIAAES